jgi:hypothetical protein
VSLSTEAIIFTPFPLMFIYSGLLLSRRAVAREATHYRAIPSSPSGSAPPQSIPQPRPTRG